MTRYTQPEPELRLLISQLKLRLPTQPPATLRTGAPASPRRAPFPYLAATRALPSRRVTRYAA